MMARYLYALPLVAVLSACPAGGMPGNDCPQPAVPVPMTALAVLPEPLGACPDRYLDVEIRIVRGIEVMRRCGPNERRGCFRYGRGAATEIVVNIEDPDIPAILAHELGHWGRWCSGTGGGNDDHEAEGFHDLRRGILASAGWLP